MGEPQKFPCKLFDSWYETQIIDCVRWQMCVIAHDERNRHGPGIENGGQDHKAWTRDVNQIGFESVQYRCSLHFGQVQGQSYLVVQREGKPECVGYFASKDLRGKLIFGCSGIYRQHLDLVASLGEELQHLIETVGVSRDMGERSWFHHETDLARRIAIEGRRIVRFGGLAQIRAASGWCIICLGLKGKTRWCQKGDRQDRKRWRNLHCNCERG